MRHVELFQLFGRFFELVARQGFARFGHRFGQGERLANRLKLGIDLTNVVLRLLLLDCRLHQRNLGQRLSRLHAGLLQLFDRLLQLGDELFDFRVLLFAGKFFERFQLVAGPVGRIDDRCQRLGRAGVQIRGGVVKTDSSTAAASEATAPGSIRGVSLGTT